MDKLIEMAFQQGGMALAFVVMLFAYRELWAQRTKELQERLKDNGADRRVLLAVLDTNTKAFMSLDNTLKMQQADTQNSRTEMRGKADTILGELKDQAEALASHRLEEEKILGGRDRPEGTRR